MEANNFTSDQTDLPVQKQQAAKIIQKIKRY